MGEITKDRGMVGEITNPKSPLLPDRLDQPDYFVCDIFDAAPKGDMASMEHPIFSLSTKPDRRARRYENGASYVEVRPSPEGLATIHDRDILIYCISQIMAALNRNEKVSQTVRLRAFDLLKATNRVTDGRGYDGLRSALARLQGTQIETNIVTGETEQLDIFSIIDRARIVRQTRDGRMQIIEIKLSDWVFNAIRAQEVLTLHRDYFRLRKPLERRIYELARKHCGRQDEWRITLDNLQNKCGSISTSKEFRRLVGTICEQDEAHGHMPDYTIRLVDDVLIVRNRRTRPNLLPGNLDALRRYEPDDATFAKARQAAPGWDVHALVREWKEWAAGKEAPRNPAASFVGFCRKKEPLR